MATWDINGHSGLTAEAAELVGSEVQEMAEQLLELTVLADVAADKRDTARNAVVTQLNHLAAMSPEAGILESETRGTQSRRYRDPNVVSPVAWALARRARPGATQYETRRGRRG